LQQGERTETVVAQAGVAFLTLLYAAATRLVTSIVAAAIAEAKGRSVGGYASPFRRVPGHGRSACHCGPSVANVGYLTARAQ
jgi:hypothetical protein